VSSLVFFFFSVAQGCDLVGVASELATSGAFAGGGDASVISSFLLFDLVEDFRVVFSLRSLDKHCQTLKINSDRHCVAIPNYFWLATMYL